MKTFFSVWFAVVLPMAGFAQEAGTCPKDQVVTLVQAARFYADSHGSIIDPQKLRQSLDLIAPLRKFVTDASRRADSADHADQECAYNMMLGWAQGKAMLEEPKDFFGWRERERFGIALNIIALKLQAEGFNINPLLDWLGRLNHGVIEDFRKFSHLGNLYIWSAVAAASYALLSGDDMARQYEDMVWSHGISMIRPDGYIDTELARAARALGYHEYNLSALLTLHAFRKALGESLSGEEHAALKRLVDRVAGSLCDPSAIAAASGGYQQEKVAVLQFSPAVAFGKNLDLGDPLFGSCAPQKIPTTDPILGGNFDKTVRTITRS